MDNLDQPGAGKHSDDDSWFDDDGGEGEPRDDAREAQEARYETMIDLLRPGICFFDKRKRLALCNRRYAELYQLSFAQARPGLTLHEIVERRFAPDAGPGAGKNFLAQAAVPGSGHDAVTFVIKLDDERTIQIRHQNMLDGGWVAIHEELTEGQAANRIDNQQLSFQTLIDCIPHAVWIKDGQSRFIAANKATAWENGRANPAKLLGLTDFDLQEPDAARRLRASEKDIIRGGKAIINREEVSIDKLGRKRWLSSTKVPLRDADGKIVGVAGVARDVTARKCAEALLEGQVQILELCAAGASLEDVLENLVHLVECQANGIFGAILLVDDDGEHLRVGAAPSLAAEFANVVGTINIAHIATSCGAALYRREFVVVSDISTDPLWDDYRELAGEHGYRSCWSMPIFSSDDGILATFAMYSETRREPSAAEIALAEVTGRIARALIELKRANLAAPTHERVTSTAKASAIKTSGRSEPRAFNIVGSSQR